MLLGLRCPRGRTYLTGREAAQRMATLDMQAQAGSKCTPWATPQARSELQVQAERVRRYLLSGVQTVRAKKGRRVQLGLFLPSKTMASHKPWL